MSSDLLCIRKSMCSNMSYGKVKEWVIEVLCVLWNSHLFTHLKLTLFETIPDGYRMGTYQQTNLLFLSRPFLRDMGWWLAAPQAINAATGEALLGSHYVHNIHSTFVTYCLVTAQFGGCYTVMFRGEWPEIE